MGYERVGKIWEFVVVGLFLVILAVFAIFLSPIWIPYLIFDRLWERLAGRRFRRYLVENEGATFFCYTNRHTSEEYVETKIVPFLEDVRIFKISDKRWSNLLDAESFQVRIVWAMKTAKGGFPYVSKVVNGNLITESINSRLYRAITRKADADVILKRIEKFYK